MCFLYFFSRLLLIGKLSENDLKSAINYSKLTSKLKENERSSPKLHNNNDNNNHHVANKSKSKLTNGSTENINKLNINKSKRLKRINKSENRSIMHQNGNGVSHSRSSSSGEVTSNDESVNGDHMEYNSSNKNNLQYSSPFEIKAFVYIYTLSVNVTQN